jgi:hypothetical protein
MWGIFDDGDPSDGVPYSFKTGLSGAWVFATNAVSASTPLRDENPVNQDLGAWIVGNVKKEAKKEKEGAEEDPKEKKGGSKKNPTAPEPVSLAVWSLIGLCFGTAGCRRRA